MSWETLDFHFVNNLLQYTTVSDTGWSSCKLDSDLCSEELTECDLEEVDMLDAVLQEVLLYVLDEYLSFFTISKLQ